MTNTNDKYTEDDIRAAFKKAAPEFDDVPTVDGVMDILKRPKWQPAEGEVLAFRDRGGDLEFVVWGDTSITFAEGLRPLNTTEVPALGAAIDALEDLSEGGNPLPLNTAHAALTKIKGMHND